jgi:hypothetical protein
VQDPDGAEAEARHEHDHRVGKSGLYARGPDDPVSTIPIHDPVEAGAGQVIGGQNAAALRSD